VSRSEDRREPEPVIIRDKRRIDPETGAVRAQPAQPHGVEEVAGSGAPAAVRDAGGHATAVVEDAVVVEDITVEEASDPVQAELLERTADLQRVSAEYANYRRRVERDRQAVVDVAKSSVVRSLLGVLDDLDRARNHGDLEGPLKAVAEKLADALAGQGLTAFGAVGDAFDPAVHEAVSHEGAGGAPVVSLVMRQGYGFGGRVLRPAMVAVSETGDPAVSETPGPAVSETPGPVVSETPGPVVSETPGPAVSETPAATAAKDDA